MKQKYGFTLSEILIALTIIGVIAALTLPGLYADIEKKKITSNLAKSIQQIELGVHNLMQEDFIENSSAQSYSDRLFDINNLDLDRINEAMGAVSINSKSSLKKVKQPSIKEYNGSSHSHDWSGFANFKKFKSSYAIQLNEEASNNEKRLANTDFAEIYIDTNGFNNGQNKLGKDVFAFKLRNDGKLVPYGLNEENDTWRDTCNNTISNGKSCAARVLADGFKINYD